MSDWPHLNRAPITEALIDIRVGLPPGSGMESLSAFRDALSAKYPNCRERKSFSGQLVFSQAGPPVVKEASGGPDGLLLTSADATEVVQGRIDGFTFSRLKSYQDWEHLRDTARDCWNAYRQAVQPLAVTRIAVRYINRIELPLPLGDFREWLLTVPEVPRTLPQELAGFFSKLHIPFDELRGFVNLIQVMEIGEYKEIVPLVLDIDAFAAEQFEPDDEKVWSRLEDLRKIKNKVFFGSITAKTMEMYK